MRETIRGKEEEEEEEVETERKRIGPLCPRCGNETVARITCDCVTLDLF